MSIQRMTLTVVAALTATGGSVLLAETVTVRELADDGQRLDQWVRSQDVVNISGRYDGRVGRQMTLARLPIRISPGRTAILPADLDAGQRITVSGKLSKNGSRYVLNANRIFAGPPDLTLLHKAAAQLPPQQPKARYELADRFAPIAEFYNDVDLAGRVQQLRLEAFELERDQLKSDPEGLLKLKDRAAALGIDSGQQQALVFQSLMLRFQQSQQRTAAPSSKLLQDIQERLPGWDQPLDFSNPDIAAQFLKDPVAAYNAAEDFERRKMHRQLFRKVRLQQVVSGLKEDGSNGDDVAAKIVLELPEEETAINDVRGRYVEYRLKRVPFLTRKQLEDLELLLKKAERQAEFDKLIDRWLEAQRKRLNDQQLNGMLMMADEYRFAWERWQQKRHADEAADLLKRAYMKSVKEAPREAKKILTQLEQLGWTRLHDRWMTRDDVRSLPKNDVELALRERRVVAGMSPAQVTSILGQPNRRIKVVSGKHVQEIWLFEDGGSNPISVHMQRRRFEDPEEAVCLLVTTAA